MTALPLTYNPPAFESPEIIYSDDYLLIVNKAPGLLSVPGRGEEKKDCLISRVNMNVPEALVVHRLDMQTSGLMILARNKTIHSELSKCFEQRQVQKEYVAIVDGHIRQAQGEINLPLITDWPNRPKQKVDMDSGKPSLTHFNVITYDETLNTTRVLLEPVTGRSHQLRVHLMSIGHVILGDALYASEEIIKKADRLLLHASKITINHPVTQKLLSVESKVPF